MQLRALALVVAAAVVFSSRAATAHSGEVMVAASAGALMPEVFSSLGPSWQVGVEAGWVAPAWGRRIALSFELALGMPEATGQLQSAAGPGTVEWHAQVREVTLAVAVELRQPIGRFVPYLRVGPRLVIADALVGGRSSGTRLATTREDSTALGIGLVPGVGFSLPPGQLFVELPVALVWRVGPAPRLTGDFNASSLAVTAGYRIFF